MIRLAIESELTLCFAYCAHDFSRDHWRFPSDHLPVGCSLGNGGPTIVSWNVMSSRYPISNLEGQGLKGALCWEQYKRKGHGANVTLRDCVVLRVLASWIVEGNPWSADVLALQECTQHVLKKLTPLLDDHAWAVAGKEHFDDALILYNTKRLELEGTPQHVVPSSVIGRGSATRALRIALFRDKDSDAGLRFRVIAGKIPGNPTGEHLKEWARYVASIDGGDGIPLFLLGDFNFLEKEVLEAVLDRHTGSLDARPRPLGPREHRYETNMSPQVVPDGFGGGPLAPKRIDHIFYASNGSPTLPEPWLIPASCILPDGGIAAEITVLRHSGRPHADMLPRGPSTVLPLWEATDDLTLSEVNAWQRKQNTKGSGKRGKIKESGPPTLW